MTNDSISGRQLLMPYCVMRLEDGRHIVLNRKYKPLGNPTRDWVKYEDDPSAVRFKGLTAARAAKMSWEGSPNLEAIYLYNDGCIPDDGVANWRAYCLRLAVLMKLETERTGSD